MENKCLSCGEPLKGKYCSSCGERVVEPNDFSIKRALGDFFQALTFVDNKFLRSFWLLFRKPGFLSSEYVLGRRVPYMRPIGMFFIANIFYFLFAALNDFNPSLSAQVYYSPYKDFAKTRVDNKLEKVDLDYKVYETVYNNKSEYYAKTIIFVNVPILALFMYALLFWQRKYYVEHLTFTIHLYAGLLFLFTFVPIIYKVITGLLSASLPDLVPQLLIISLVVAYILTSVRNFYKNSWFKTTLITIYTFSFWFVSLAVFKFILLLLTLATT